MASTPHPDVAPASASNLKKARASAVQLISDLPVARQEALATFNELIENNYQYKSLGRSREVLESMTCDCLYEHGQFGSFTMFLTSFELGSPTLMSINRCRY